MIKNDSLIDNLKREAETNPVFNALCLVFASRVRTRSDLHTVSLTHKMEREGFLYTKEEYSKCLEFLASQGIGKLIRRDKKGVSLMDINVSLQSIGQTALDKNTTSIEEVKKPKHFSQIVKDRRSQSRESVVTKSINSKPVEITESTNLVDNEITLRVKGLTINFPKSMPSQEIVSLIEKLRS